MKELTNSQAIIATVLILWAIVIGYYLINIFKGMNPVSKIKFTDKKGLNSIEVNDEENLSTEHKSIINIIHSQDLPSFDFKYEEVGKKALSNNMPLNGRPDFSELKKINIEDILITYGLGRRLNFHLYSQIIRAKNEMFSLIEITEMYHDYLISQKQTEGIPFKIVQETLNKIAYGNTNQKN